MKSIPVTPDEHVLTELLRQAREENLILTTEDGREFLLAEIDAVDREAELIRQNDELMRLLDSRGAESATIPLAEAKARLGVDQAAGAR